MPFTSGATKAFILKYAPFARRKSSLATFALSAYHYSLAYPATILVTLLLSYMLSSIHSTQHLVRHEHRILTKQISYIVCACPKLPMTREPRQSFCPPRPSQPSVDNSDAGSRQSDGGNQLNAQVGAGPSAVLCLSIRLFKPITLPGNSIRVANISFMKERVQAVVSHCFIPASLMWKVPACHNATCTTTLCTH